MTIAEIQTVCFVGAGAMGCFNSLKAAVSGYTVVLHDNDSGHLQQASQRHLDVSGFLVATGYCTAQEISTALKHITCEPDLERAVADADLISESVFERLDLKREVHQRLDEISPVKTILTTNSSYLLLSDIEDVVARGDRIAAMHSYMASPLMDIVGGPRTSAATIDTLERYVESLNATPLVLRKEHRGYVLNAVLGPVLATAMWLLVEKVASIEEVDRAWMHQRSAPMGPLGILDLIGLGLVRDSWLEREDDGPIPGLRSGVLQLLDPLVTSGSLGMQSGSGFYQYPDPVYQQTGFLAAEPVREDVYEALAVAMVAGALLVAQDNVADPVDIDRAWMIGTSLDKGPFAILEQLGVPCFRSMFEQHVAAGRFDAEKACLVTEYLDGSAQPGQERLI